MLSVTIDRPDSLNSLTAAMLTGIADALEQAAGDPRVKVVRLGGAGRGFCSGAGISDEDMSATGGEPNARGSSPRPTARSGHRSRLPQPVVAAVHGPAAGVGVSLALACDLVLASEKAFFMLAFTKIGLMPDGGASALIAAAIGRIRAMRMALLAERIPAAEALSWGLVTAVYPAEHFDAEVDKVVSTLVSGPVVALPRPRTRSTQPRLTELEPALEREFQGQLGLLGVRRLQ